MKILHVTDLHFGKSWFDWISSEAPNFDLICATGDLMSLMESSETGDPLPDPTNQAVFIARWLGDLPVPVALCSGNHEIDGSLEIWKLQSPDSIVVDLESRAIGDVVVTCLPFIFGFSTPDTTVDAWVEGKTLADALGLPWLVLHHDPSMNARWANAPREQISRYQPDLFLCGHQHDWPREMGFATPFHSSTMLNPGVGTDPCVPNHIIIDTDKRSAIWRSGDAAHSFNLPSLSVIEAKARSR